MQKHPSRSVAARKSEIKKAIALVMEGFRVLAESLELEDKPSDPDPILPHSDWPIPRSRAVRLAKRVEGARKIGRLWYARRSAVDAFIEGAPAPPQAPANDKLDDELAALGFGGRR
jgi:hypothetical protein